MTIVKVYQSLVGQIHHTSVKVDGKEVNITFSGADGDNLGTLTTVDESLQKAIESDPAFNIRFKFIKEYRDEGKGMVGPGKIIQGPLTGDKLSGSGLLVGEDDSAVDVANDKNNSAKTKTFKTVNEAQEFFCAEPYNLTKTSIRTTDAVVEAGKKLGIEVVFSRE